MGEECLIAELLCVGLMDGFLSRERGQSPVDVPECGCLKKLQVTDKERLCLNRTFQFRSCVNSIVKGIQMCVSPIQKLLVACCLGEACFTAHRTGLDCADVLFRYFSFHFKHGDFFSVILS